MIKLFFWVFYVLAKKCIPDKYECSDTKIRVCSAKGNWSTIECPINTACAKTDSAILCSNDAYVFFVGQYKADLKKLGLTNSFPRSINLLKSSIMTTNNSNDVLDPAKDLSLPDKSYLSKSSSPSYSEVNKDVNTDKMARDQDKSYQGGTSPEQQVNNKPSYTGNDKLSQSPKKGLNESSSAGKTSGNKIITPEQLIKAMQENNFNPPSENINAIIKETNEYFDDPQMAAMFLGQCAHESNGFVHREEEGCQKNACITLYSTGGAPGQSYHGRGFLKIAYPENYKLLSLDLGYGNKLWEKPELVSEDPALSAKVSTWYWETRVMKFPNVTEKKLFGLTTKAINGSEECQGKNIEKSKRRYNLYKSIAMNMGITSFVGEGGCY